jgi:mono/diheme cytochrome c family protein
MEQPDAISRARAREKAEPAERNRPISMAYFAFAIVLLFWGTWYILTEANDAGYYGDHRTVEALRPHKPAAGAVDGAQLFGAKCVACHQAAGTGVPGVFPPLAGSEWVQGDPKILVKLVLLGVSGEIEVKGAKYNGLMPPFKDTLSDAEIAAVLSYVRSQWGNSAPPVDAAAVTEGRAAVGGRGEPWKGGQELRAAAK